MENKTREALEHFVKLMNEADKYRFNLKPSQFGLRVVKTVKTVKYTFSEHSDSDFDSDFPVYVAYPCSYDGYETYSCFSGNGDDDCHTEEEAIEECCNYILSLKKVPY